MTDLPTATLGRTGLRVTKLGFGAMELRGTRSGTAERARDVLDAVLTAGINFIDTSPDYGISEELIGEHLSERRSEFILASKCGCPVNPPPGQRPAHVFTPENIRAGVEQSLRRMKTDYLDIVQVHASPPRSVLEKEGAVDALRALQGEGKVRFLGMSGTLPHLEDHIAMGVFDVFQIPYSALEREHEQVISAAARAGAGIIIRGGVARGAPAENLKLERIPEFWREIAETRRDLWTRANLDGLLEDGGRMQFILRFTLTHPDLHTTIVGTLNPRHLADNLAAIRAGPLPEGVYTEAKRRLAEAAAGA
jgi:aryl-alcohol dehydrogenase-like predicted oxidoreductase